MENASKALIIAGSILLSILIIALGMYIFSTSSSTSNVEILNETEIQTFNAKFEKYKGSQLGSSVDSLISALRSNATTNAGANEKIPTVTTTANNSSLNGSANRAANGTTDSGTYINALNDLSRTLERSHRYTVTMTYDAQGLINTINIAY